MPSTHDLKCWPEPFAAIVRGEKRHEIRRFDRDYKVGDVLVLREWNPTTKEYTGPWCAVRVTYIAAPGTWGLPSDIGVMSIISAHEAHRTNGGSNG